MIIKIFLLLIALAIASPAFAVVDTYYLDTVAGDDENTCLSEAQACKSTSQIVAAGFGGYEMNETVLKIKRGSVVNFWKPENDSLAIEELIANATIEDYGSGEKPILTASTTVPKASFVLHTGNVYYVEVPGGIKTEGISIALLTNVVSPMETLVTLDWCENLACVTAETSNSWYYDDVLQRVYFCLGPEARPYFPVSRWESLYIGLPTQWGERMPDIIVYNDVTPFNLTIRNLHFYDAQVVAYGDVLGVNLTGTDMTGGICMLMGATVTIDSLIGHWFELSTQLRIIPMLMVGIEYESRLAP